VDVHLRVWHCSGCGNRTRDNLDLVTTPADDPGIDGTPFKEQQDVFFYCSTCGYITLLYIQTGADIDWISGFECSDGRPPRDVNGKPFTGVGRLQHLVNAADSTLPPTGASPKGLKAAYAFSNFEYPRNISVTVVGSTPQLDVNRSVGGGGDTELPLFKQPVVCDNGSTLVGMLATQDENEATNYRLKSVDFVCGKITRALHTLHTSHVRSSPHACWSETNDVVYNCQVKG
jgi:hypothetical protein